MYLTVTDAVQEVALVELQLTVEEPPEDTLVGLALNVTVGAAPLTQTVASCGALVPPEPLQVQ